MRVHLIIVRWQESGEKMMLKGTISLLTDRGYGFIAPDSEGFSDYLRELARTIDDPDVVDVDRSPVKGVFFHSNDLPLSFDDLNCGQAVKFELVAGKYGPRAHRIDLLGKAPGRSDYYELTARPTVVVVRALQECNAELVEYLTEHPDSLRDLHPGTFENLVAEIFRHEGFETERISGWNQPDGGVDLIAVWHFSTGNNIRIAIQCKRWAQSRPISAEPIRTLAGVLDRFRAHAGVVATTGFFSKTAEEETTQYLWRISLRDYNDILASLKRLRLTQ